MENSSSKSLPKMSTIKNHIHTRMLVFIAAVSSIGASGGRMKVILADETGMKKAFFNSKHENKLKKGRKLFIKNFVVKNNIIYINENSSVFYGSGQLEIPEEILANAEQSLHAPTSPMKNVEDVLKSPVKSKVCFKGRLITQTMTKTVKVKEMDTKVKECTIGDTTGEVRVSLWRDASKFELTVGEEVIVTDGTLSYNNYFKSVIVNVNSLDEIKEIENMEPEEVTIMGVSDFEEVTEMVDVTCCVGDADRELSIKKTDLIRITGSDILFCVDDVIEKLPIKINCCVKKGVIIFA